MKREGGKYYLYQKHIRLYGLKRGRIEQVLKILTRIRSMIFIY